MTNENTNPVIAPDTPPAGEPVAPPPPLPPAVPTPPTRRYAPGLATWLSLVPGLGHVYLGLYQRAVIFFCAGAAAAWFTDRADIGPLLIFFVWPFTMIDANRQAHAINSGLCPEPLEGAEYPKSRHRSSLGFGIFLTALGVFMLYNQFYPVDMTFLLDWWPMLLVLAGIYLVARHFLEQKRRREVELQATE